MVKLSMFRNVTLVHKGCQTRRVNPGVTSRLRHTAVIVTGQVYSTDGQKSIGHKNSSERQANPSTEQ